MRGSENLVRAAISTDMDIVKDYYTASVKRVRFHQWFLVWLSLLLMIAAMDGQAFDGVMHLLSQFVGDAVNPESFARWFAVPFFAYAIWVQLLFVNRWQLRDTWIDGMASQNCAAASSTPDLDFVLRDDVSVLRARDQTAYGLTLRLIVDIFIAMLPVIAYFDVCDKILRDELGAKPRETLVGDPGTYGKPLQSLVFWGAYTCVAVAVFANESARLGSIRKLRGCNYFRLGWPRLKLLYVTLPAALATEFLLSFFLIEYWGHEKAPHTYPWHPFLMTQFLQFLVICVPPLLLFIMPLIAWRALESFPSRRMVVLCISTSLIVAAAIGAICVTAIVDPGRSWQAGDKWRGFVVLGLATSQVIFAIVAYCVVCWYKTLEPNPGEPRATIVGPDSR